MEPVLLKDILPCAALHNYVRKFQIVRFTFEKNVAPPIKYHTPRPEHSITFYVRDPQKFSLINSGTVTKYPPCVINGIYTIPINRYGGHDFCAIKVVFHPTALSRAKIVKVIQLNNHYVNAEEFFGNDILLLCEQLFHLHELGDMLNRIESFFYSAFQ